MKVAIIQSSYIPWRGYFDIIDDVDLFIYYDDVQYTRRDWRNRNKIKTANGTIWLTVSVKDVARSQKIIETELNYATKWNETHIQQIHYWYKKSPFYALYFDELAELLTQKEQTISLLNKRLTGWLMQKLFINTKIMCSSELENKGTKTQGLVDLLTKVSASSYLSGPSAKAYMDESLFRASGIGLEYKAYDYAAYPQIYGDFVGEVSVLDLLFNAGPEAREFMKSRSPSLVVL